MSKKCKCGSTLVYWYDYGKTYEYIQTIGASIEEREVTEVHDTRLGPIYCRCVECNKRYKILEIEQGGLFLRSEIKSGQK